MANHPLTSLRWHVAAILSLLLLAAAVPARAFLADDFSLPLRHGRILVGGTLQGGDGALPVAAARGGGWRSEMRFEPGQAGFYGRRDYVLYRPLQPGSDLPLESGQVQLRLRRDRPHGSQSQSDNLLQFLAADGETLATVAVTYADPPQRGMINLYLLGEIWGELLPLPPIAVGEEFTLVLSWGPDGRVDNRCFVNDREVTDDATRGSGDFSRLLQKTSALRLGLGWDDSDPAYQTLFASLRFSATDPHGADLARPIPLPLP